jgi:hypothetical protein
VAVDDQSGDRVCLRVVAHDDVCVLYVPDAPDIAGPSMPGVARSPAIGGRGLSQGDRDQHHGVPGVSYASDADVGR